MPIPVARLVPKQRLAVVGVGVKRFVTSQWFIGAVWLAMVVSSILFALWALAGFLDWLAEPLALGV